MYPTQMFWVGTWLSSMLVLNKSLCRLAIAAVLAGALIMSFGPAGGTLVFVDERPLELTWEQVEAGVDVAVCNMGNASVQSLQATLTGFNFRMNKTVVSDETVLRTPPSNISLEGGNCAEVHIQATDGSVSDPPDPGEYTGQLVLADLDADIIVRRVVTIELRPLESAVDEIVLTATRWPLYFDIMLPTAYILNYPTPLSYQVISFDRPNLPLKPPGSNETLCHLKNDTYLGIVYSEGHIGRVYVNGMPDNNTSQDGVVLLPIRIEGLDAVGTYSGKLDLIGSCNDGGTIPVKVEVTDNIWWAISTIVLGLLISFSVLQSRGKTRVKTLLNKASEDRGVLILTGVVAILTGLNQFYFDKTFGTPGDYIQLFVLGAGTYVAVNGARVASMRLLDI